MTCAHCQTLLKVETIPPLRHFLCHPCGATTFIHPDAQDDGEIVKGAGLEYCPMCGAETDGTSSQCGMCGEPLAGEKVSSNIGQDTWRITDVTPRTIRWFEWGTAFFGIGVLLPGLGIIKASSQPGISFPDEFIIGALFLLILGVAILARQNWAILIAGLLLVVATAYYSCLGITVLFTPRLAPGRWNARVPLLLLLPLLYLGTGLGFQVWNSGRKMLSAGFSRFISPRHLPTGYPVEMEKRISQGKRNSLN